jgi:hypothetical protein
LFAACRVLLLLLHVRTSTAAPIAVAAAAMQKVEAIATAHVPHRLPHQHVCDSDERERGEEQAPQPAFQPTEERR